MTRHAGIRPGAMSHDVCHVSFKGIKPSRKHLITCWLLFVLRRFYPGQLSLANPSPNEVTGEARKVVSRPLCSLVGAELCNIYQPHQTGAEGSTFNPGNRLLDRRMGKNQNRRQHSGEIMGCSDRFDYSDHRTVKWVVVSCCSRAVLRSLMTSGSLPSSLVCPDVPSPRVVLHLVACGGVHAVPNFLQVGGCGLSLDLWSVFWFESVFPLCPTMAVREHMALSRVTT